MKRFEVIGLGALNIDNIYRVEHILTDGEAVIDDVKSFPGGSAANTIYGLSKLGIATGFIGAIGGDDWRKVIVQDFNNIGVDTSHIIIKNKEKTGKTLCLSDSSGIRSIYVIPGANSRLNIEDIDISYLNTADLIHISSFANEKQFQLLLNILDKISPLLKISFSPGELYAGKRLKALTPLLSKVHILFINQHELEALTGKDIIAGTEICLEQGCRIIVVTLGKGKRLSGMKIGSAICYIKDENGEYFVEPSGIVEKCIDTTGAGDAFATGFLYGLLKGKRVKDCALLGDIVAQFSIIKIGARQGLPTLKQLAQRYFELYNRQL